MVIFPYIFLIRKALDAIATWKTTDVAANCSTTYHESNGELNWIFVFLMFIGFQISMIKFGDRGICGSFLLIILDTPSLQRIKKLNIWYKKLSTKILDLQALEAEIYAQLMQL